MRKRGNQVMKKARLFSPILVVCLCLFISSIAYSEIIHYHGYAVLYNTDTQGRLCAIISDGGGQYMDRDPNETGSPDLRGNKIEISYDTTANPMIPTYFRCFMGKPELPWRSDRRVKFNFDIAQGAIGNDYASNQTVADMLTNKYFDDSGNRISPVPRGILNDGSAHISVARGNYEDPRDSLALFLVDKTDVATDPNAITQANLKKIDKKAPSYWTALQGSAGGSEVDPHDQIAFLLYYQVDDPGQFKFTVLESDVKGPITWLVEPNNNAVNLEVRRLNKGKYIRQVLRTFSSGLPFSLVMSKYPINGDPRPISPAPPKNSTSAITWGTIKSQ